MSATSLTLDAPQSTVSRSIRTLVATNDSSAQTVLRLALATVMFAHGAQKAFGWWGGYGFEGTMGFFTSLGIPYAFGFLAIATEVVGSLALVLGLGTRVAAFGMGAIAAVAALKVHLPNGFYMNWSGQQAGEGIEIHILIVAMAAALVIAGAGKLSLDRLLAREQ